MIYSKAIALPINAFFRYSIPFIFKMPRDVALFINILKDKNNNLNNIEEVNDNEE